MPPTASRSLAVAAAAAALFSLPGASQPQREIGTSIEVRFENLRSNRGTLRFCLNRDPNHYPDCSGDPHARRVNVPASSGSYVFDNVPIGTFVITAMHDENGNGELDTFLGIPREGFAFSNNPSVGFGAPRYNRVRFSIGPSRALVRLQFKYIG
jgi:uncharacterized protein (DUF2141 family)